MITMVPGHEGIAPRTVALSSGVRQELTMRNPSTPRVVYAIEDVGR